MTGNKLKNIYLYTRYERFWHWLFRTALGKVQHHYRDQGRVRMAQFSELSKERLSEHIWEAHDDGLSHVVRRELSETICRAIADLRVIYRNVVILRCFIMPKNPGILKPPH